MHVIFVVSYHGINDARDRDMAKCINSIAIARSLNEDRREIKFRVVSRISMAFKKIHRLEFFTRLFRLS